MTALEVGQSVRVFDVNGARVGQPEGGWPGEVVRVGRKLVYITFARAAWNKRESGEAFRLDDGQINDNHGNRYFLTVEEADYRLRRETAVTALREVGIHVQTYSRLSLEQIEALAAVAAGFEQEDDR